MVSEFQKTTRMFGALGRNLLFANGIGITYRGTLSFAKMP